MQRPRGRPLRSNGLHEEFGHEFQKVASLTEMHRTPRGTEQQFVYCYCGLTHVGTCSLSGAAPRAHRKAR